MQDNARKMTYGAMMIAIFAILLAITVYVPLLGIITIFFVPLPIILYRLRYDRAASILVATTGIFVSLLGGIALFPFAILFGLLGLVIGDTVQTGKTKLYTFMASGLTILVITMLSYVATIALLGINVIEEMLQALQASQREILSLMGSFKEVPKDFEQQMQATMDLAIASIPSAFILTSFSLGLIIVIVNLAIAKRLGHETPKFPPFRSLKLPMITIWSYLLILLLPLLMTVDEDTTLYLIVVNATAILRLLFAVQGLALIHHYMYEMKLPIWVTIISTIIAVLLTPITILLGILDIGMNIRAWIGKGKSN